MCAKVVHRNTIEFRQKCHHAPVDEGADDLLGKLRVRSRQRRCLGLRHHDGAHDVAGGEAAALAGEFVATARSARSFEDSVSHERLKHWFEMPRRQFVPGRERLGGDWLRPGVERDIRHRRDGEERTPRQKVHVRSRKRPVEPKPPAARDVSSTESTSITVTAVTGATTIWAIRIPRVTVKGSAPRLTRITCTSPR